MNLSKLKNLVVRNINLIASCTAIVSINASVLANLNKTNDLDSLEKKSKIEFSMDNFNNYKTQVVSRIAENPSFKKTKRTINRLKYNLKKATVELQEKLSENSFSNRYHDPEYVSGLIDSYKAGYDLEDETNIDTSKFELTLDNQTYGHLTEEDFYLFTAIVASECNGNTHDAVAVASSILNRCDSEKWVSWVDSMNKDGNNPIDQVTLHGQYQVYWSGSYRKNLDGNVPEEVMNACVAVWYDGVRNNNYMSFRSNGSRGYSNNQVVSGGNRFNDELTEENKVKVK